MKMDNDINEKLITNNGPALMRKPTKKERR